MESTSETQEKLYVVNRSGKREAVHFDEITRHLYVLSTMPPVLDEVDEALLAKKAIDTMIPGITTSQIDNLLAEEAGCMARQSDQYVQMAARIAIHNLHKDVRAFYARKIGPASSRTYVVTYGDVVAHLWNNHYSGHHAPLISKEIFTMVLLSKEIGSADEEQVKEFYKSVRDIGCEETMQMRGRMNKIEAAIDHSRDYDLYTYFGIMTIIRKYLNHNVETKEILELPQHMLMTVSLGIHGTENIDDAIHTYHRMSQGYFTHATPTLLNSGRRVNQMASCYLLAMGGDSLVDICECWRRCAMISQGGGGIGINVSILRARGSPIKRFNGVAHGVGHELMGVFNAIARYVDQGGGKRKGAFAAYLEPWHADIEEFLDLRGNKGSVLLKCNDMHFGLWIPDLFMERVLLDKEWSLFCPTEAPDLYTTYGEEFEALYVRYERQGKARKTMRAVDLWYQIVDKQQEVSEPYMLYKDACNRKSNQQHLGTIRGSNLCTEIVEYTSEDEVAVCMLASIALPKYIIPECDWHFEGDIRVTIDDDMLRKDVSTIVRNLNREIDRMWYPIGEAEVSNKKHRPLGIGVQGLADVFAMLGVPWESEEALLFNRYIFSRIYLHAALESCQLAKDKGTYTSYKGSPASQGLLQFDLWKKEHEELTKRYAKYGDDASKFYVPLDFEMYHKESQYGTDGSAWPLMKEGVELYGLRNSLLTAPMPTATTSQLLGNNECFEPYTSNVYTRATNAGDFIVYNKHLARALKQRGLWDREMREAIFAGKGSVQDIERIPEDIKKIFKTVWEIKQSHLIRMATERGPYIDQSQSLNLHVANPTRAGLTSLHFTAWRYKLKTGSYYIRRQAESSATSFNTVSASSSSCSSSAKRPLGEVDQEEEEGEKHEEGGKAFSKKARILAACPLNSELGTREGEVDECDMCGS